MILEFPEFSVELKDALERATKYLEETIKRGFTNASVQRTWLNNSFASNQHKSATNVAAADDDKKHYSIPHVAFNVDENTYVSLRNIELSSKLDIRVTHLQWDPETMSMACQLNLGNVTIQSEYESTNEALALLLPIYNEGKLTITLSNVKGSGIVALYIHSDYFIPTLHDFNYTTTETNVKVEFPRNENNILTSTTNEITSNDVESTIVRKFWRELISILNNIIVDQFENIFKEISITELLDTQPEFVDEFKKFSQEITTNANLICDLVLTKLRRVSPKHYDKVASTTKFFRTKLRQNQKFGNFQTTTGSITNLNTLERKSLACLTNLKRPSKASKITYNTDEDDTTDDLYLYSLVKFSNLKLIYDDYCLKLLPGCISRGKISLELFDNSLAIKIQLSRNESGYILPDIKEIKYYRCRATEVDVTGLGALNNLVTDISYWCLGTFNTGIVPKIEVEMFRALRKVTQNTTIAGFTFTDKNENT